MRSSSLKAYHQLFDSIDKPFLYTAPWWLEATCGNGKWNACIHYDQEKPVAGLAFHQTSIRGLSAIITPPLTQWVTPLANREVSNSILVTMLSGLPQASIFDLTLKSMGDHRLQDDRFPVNSKYSYVLPYSEDVELIRQGYNEGLRRNIRQSENTYAITESEDISIFLSLCRSSYAQQKMKVPAWHEVVLPRVFNGLKINHCGNLFLASFQDKIIAGVLTAWDEHATYYLAGGRAEGDQAASAHALLLDHAITMAHQRKTSFDFEGSMHPGIANFFQSFGATPIPYDQIRQYRGLGKFWVIFH